MDSREERMRRGIAVEPQDNLFVLLAKNKPRPMQIDGKWAFVMPMIVVAPPQGEKVMYAGLGIHYENDENRIWGGSLRVWMLPCTQVPLLRLWRSYCILQQLNSVGDSTLSVCWEALNSSLTVEEPALFELEKKFGMEKLFNIRGKLLGQFPKPLILNSIVERCVRRELPLDTGELRLAAIVAKATGEWVRWALDTDSSLQINSEQFYAIHRFVN